MGTVLPNRYSGSIDLGVQVVAEYRRRGIGTALLREAIDGYRQRGFEHMFLIRALRPLGLRPEDEVALQFYMANGARLLAGIHLLQGGSSGTA